MCSEQKSGCGTDIELAALHEKAEKKLQQTIKDTKSITLLKKIMATGKYDKEVFVRLQQLAFPKTGNGNTEALLEVVLLTEEHKKEETKVSRSSWSQRRNL